MFEHFVLNYWTWWIAAAVLVGLEILAPGVIFLWLAIAAAIVGGVVLLIADMSWQYQLTIFSILSVLAILGGRMFLRLRPVETSDTGLNDRGSQYVGHVYTLIEPIDNGVGKVRIGDSLWSVKADFDAEIGTRVRIIGAKGVILFAEKALKSAESSTQA